ncbi:zinc transporter [Musa troglodytarum]|uniref:Zinc transporter n=1 Tax=Musa troglodytarum TaxID=320322 RepID=A0A9E7EMA3_9LILI|nr:zinc transporter [Musa troglodytarum]
MMRGASLFFLAVVLLPLLVRGDCECSTDEAGRDRKKALPLKVAAIFSILVCGSIGVCIPILGKWWPALHPEKDAFSVIKSFAAGVILATGFVHILPDAFDRLTSSCLDPSPWQKFPFAGFGAMVAAIATLMMDTVATGYFSRAHSARARTAAVIDETKADMEAPHGMHGHNDVHAHSHANHGHTHEGPSAQQLIRHRVISQVLELGIVVHSVIIGISLGASETPSTIRSLLAALSFHQFFEGIGLGGCIVQASYRMKSMVTMGLFFSLTTPVGIAVGMGTSSVYDGNSPTALVVEGLLDSAAAGILVYMALVDLLAQDFTNPRVQSKPKLQFAMSISLLAGAALMSLLAKWS